MTRAAQTQIILDALANQLRDTVDVESTIAKRYTEWFQSLLVQAQPVVQEAAEGETQ